MRTIVHSRVSQRVARQGLLLSCAILLPITPVFADTIDAVPANGIEQVVVTGTRISTRDFVANSPITTVGSADIENTGAVTLEGALANLPQFTVGSGSTTTGYYANGMATLNLRGLGTSRNLVLLDGKRLQPSNGQQVVDINTIPKAIIDNVEIITGGASAVYGSDAIAGVVNFKTRKFEGIEASAEYNSSQYGGGTQDYSVTVGGNFGHDRGNALVSLSYSKRDSIAYQDIPFFRRNQGQGDFRTGEGVYNPGTNAPSQNAVNSLFSGYGYSSGTVPAASYLSFNTDGTLYAASNGLANFKGSSELTTADGQIYYKNVYLLSQTPLERYTVFAKGSYDIAENLKGYVQAQFVSYTSTTLAESGNTTLTIPVTNPFIPTALSTLLASRDDPDASFLLEKRFYEAGPRQNNRDFLVFQLQAGLSGHINALDGDWEFYASHGETKITTTSPGSVVKSRLYTLLNASDGGASICEGGYNPFGLTTLSDECKSYLSISPQQRTTLNQDIVEANLQGHAFNLPAGEVRFAVGASYRGDDYAYRPDSDIANGTVIGVPSAQASDGSTHVYEGYAELLLPLIKNKPLIQDLNFDLAYRYSQYNLSGGASTYKADANWTIIESVRLRGGYQRAVRAPNVGELFVAPTSGSASIGEIASGGGDPCAANSSARAGANAANIKALCVAQGVPSSLIDTFTNAQNDIEATNVGNTKLKPETAGTYTVGVVLTSPFHNALLSTAQLSVDYYNIAVSDAIGVISGSEALNKCFNLDGSNPTYSADNYYCSLLSRNSSTGKIESVEQPTENLGAFKTRGLDIKADWQAGLGAFGLSDEDGTIALNAALNYLITYQVQTVKGGSWANYTNTVGSSFNGSVGSLPRLKVSTNLRYSLDGIDIGLRWRHLSQMHSVDKVSDPGATTPDTSAFDVFDLSAGWNITEAFSVRGGINNILDRDPPVVDGVAGSTESSTYDILGRVFYVSLKAKL